LGVAALTMTAGMAGAQGQAPMRVFDGEAAGIHLAATGSAAFDALPDHDTLLLRGITIGACTVADGFANAGPILIEAESGPILVHHTGGNAGKTYELAQGESVLIPERMWFTIANIGGGYGPDVDVLMLQLRETFPSATQLDDELETWPVYGTRENGATCTATRDDLTTRFAAQGEAGDGATQLYLGFGSFDAGATTAGYELAGDSASFNVMVLSGGLPTTDAGSGRADTAGPGDVISDSPSAAGDHAAIENPGALPVTGIVFGTAAAGEPVYVAVK
jgi:hypothetical protein